MFAERELPCQGTATELAMHIRAAQVDGSGGIDAPTTQPGRAWHNPYLDHDRQGEGEASAVPSGQP